MKGGLMWFRYEPAGSQYQLQPDAGLIYEVEKVGIFINTSATTGTRTVNLYKAPINDAYKWAILICTTSNVSSQHVSAGPPFLDTAGGNMPYPIKLHSEEQLIIDASGLIAGDTYGFYVNVLVESE